MNKHKTESSKFNIINLIDRTNLYVRVTGSQCYKAKNYEITMEQFDVLYLLYQEDGISQRDLAKLALKDRSNITRILNILENKELIRREIGLNKNRMIKKVYITENGKKQIDKILPEANEFFNKTLEGISNEQLKNLKLTLEMIRNNLEDNFKLQI